MQLLLVRHAVAEPRGPAWPDDRVRPLTPDGRERMATAAAGMAQLVSPRLILTSPLRRAVETAAILAAAWPRAPVRRCNALASGDAIALLRELQAVSADCVALVGHEPDCSSTLSFLLTGSEAALAATFKKGAAALVSFQGRPQPGGGRLEWLLQPRALRLLAQSRYDST